MYIYDLCKEVADTYDLTSEMFDPQCKIKSGRVDFGSIPVTEYTQLDNTAHLMMKGVADDNAHNGVPLASPDPHQLEDLR